MDPSPPIRTPSPPIRSRPPPSGPFEHFSQLCVPFQGLCWGRGVFARVEKVSFGSIWSILIVTEPYAAPTPRNLSLGGRYPLPPTQCRIPIWLFSSILIQMLDWAVRVLGHNWDRKWLNTMQTDRIWLVLMNTINMNRKTLGQNLLAWNPYITSLLLEGITSVFL